MHNGNFIGRTRKIHIVVQIVLKNKNTFLYALLIYRNWYDFEYILETMK